MNALEIIINRDISRGMSKLNTVNEAIEKYWKDALKNHQEENEDVFICDKLTELLKDHTKDNEEKAEEIFQLLFNSDDITFWLEGCDDIDIYPSDMLRMVEYFNTYYEENFGSESCIYRNLTEQTVYLHYALTYAWENGIQQEIEEWLDENLVSIIEVDTA